METKELAVGAAATTADWALTRRERLGKEGITEREGAGRRERKTKKKKKKRAKRVGAAESAAPRKEGRAEDFTDLVDSEWQRYRRAPQSRAEYRRGTPDWQQSRALGRVSRPSPVGWRRRCAGHGGVVGHRSASWKSPQTARCRPATERRRAPHSPSFPPRCACWAHTQPLGPTGLRSFDQH